MPLLQLPLTEAQFDQLPRNAAYRYDYQDGQAWLNPRPRYYHALLELEGLTLDTPAEVALRGIEEPDWEELVDLFTGAFRAQQPFAGLDEDNRRAAARRSLNQTRTGGDGPWIEEASFIATGEDDDCLGAILLTLLPLRDPTDWDAYHWPEPPPPDCIAQRQGRPHLTWIFIDPDHAGLGVGTALLAASVEALQRLGYSSLLSTFLSGNDSSMLWHWRAGFRLLSHPGSARRRSSDAWSW
jgi:GNAT superfamily N-acetyltransferase